MTTKEAAKKDDYERALSDYSQALKAFHKKEFKKAAESLKGFIEKYETERELIDRAKMYLKICETKLSNEKIQLKTFDDYYQVSILKMNEGDYQEALQLLEKARDMKPKEGKIFYLMADTYCLLGENEQCLENLKKAIQLDGFFKILAQNERDFEPLWEDKKFKLITRMA